MNRRTIVYEPTPEHQITHARWARGFAILYGTVVLVLLGLMLAAGPLGIDRQTAVLAPAPSKPIATERPAPPRP
jgi:hypothetical protein